MSLGIVMPRRLIRVLALGLLLWSSSLATPSGAVAGSPVFATESNFAIEGPGSRLYNGATLPLLVTGVHNLIIAAWHAEYDDNAPDNWRVECNGAPGKLLVDTNGYAGGNGNRRFRIYYWLNPAVGLNTILVTNDIAASDNELAVSAILLNHVAQSTPVGDVAVDVATVSRTSEQETVASAAGDLVVHVIADALYARGRLGVGETSRSVANDSKHQQDGDASLWISTKPAGASGTTVSSSGWASRVLNGVAIVLHGDGFLVPAVGTYNGLFCEDDQVRQQSAGFFTASVTSGNRYSARLVMGANRYSFRGQLDSLGQTTNVVPRTGQSPLTVLLKLGNGDQADQITGSVSSGTWNAALMGYRNVFNRNTYPAPFAAEMTVIIPGENGDPALPAGDGFGFVRVDSGGKVKFAGQLGDATKVSQSASLSVNGDWPVYLSLNGGTGLVFGWLNVMPQFDSDVNGTLSWIKSVDATSSFYANGFTNESEIVGSVYRRPVKGLARLLNITNGLVAFSGGNLISDFTNFISLDINNRVGDLSTNPLTLKFSSATGIVKGKVKDTTLGDRWSYSGVVLQNLNIARGFLSGSNQTSRVEVRSAE